MNPRSLVASIAVVGLAAACSYSNPGVPGSPAVSHPDLPGTVFTILFENHDSGAVNNADMPFLMQMAQQYARADSYQGNVHPSLPNYLLLTSGSTQNVTDDNDPASHPLAGTDNLGDQLDAAGVPWRAYMESMGEPCVTTNRGQYAARHDPWVYYTSMSGDNTRCRDRVVDFDQNFATDLAADHYRYMWITPNVCNDMHDCPPATADAWLRRVIPQIQASPGYQRGGAIFILFDEGSLNLSYLVGAQQNLAAVVISPNLVSSGYHSTTAYNHTSYVATIEDVFGLPRLATTTGATPMADFFRTTTSGGNGPLAGGAAADAASGDAAATGTTSP